MDSFAKAPVDSGAITAAEFEQFEARVLGQSALGSSEMPNR
ncbi:hypothetical protein [Rhodococcus chondri]|uniref:Uncharacterized protein n=1 Tax=Rhodococcus chondri TaxID=3065941 RepID=A0ABU7JVH8_9NOCA|nr:hypothetical protein [Rhodococcus sp. CC-R104]MEE2033835.1 hypothetical protein [Rhodococcus sp. CC-R104]